MPPIRSRASRVQHAGRDNSRNPGNIASSSQQSAPANTPAGGSPDNGPHQFRFQGFQDADIEDVDGYVVPGQFDNSENGNFVMIRLVRSGDPEEPRRPDLNIGGEGAMRFRQTVGRDWADYLTLTVRFEGIVPRRVTYREPTESDRR